MQVFTSIRQLHFQVNLKIFDSLGPYISFSLSSIIDGRMSIGQRDSITLFRVKILQRNDIVWFIRFYRSNLRRIIRTSRCFGNIGRSFSTGSLSTLTAFLLFFVIFPEIGDYSGRFNLFGSVSYFFLLRFWRRSNNFPVIILFFFLLFNL